MVVLAAARESLLSQQFFRDTLPETAAAAAEAGRLLLELQQELLLL